MHLTYLYPMLLHYITPHKTWLTLDYRFSLVPKLCLVILIIDIFFNRREGKIVIMLNCLIILGLMCGLVISEPPVNGIKPTNFVGGAEQHASFSFIRPGLTQTSYSFNGPSSHQAFSSSIGNPHLAQKVFPNVAQALAYRNPGLGYFSTAPVASPYMPQSFPVASSVPLSYQQPQLDPATLAYYQAQQFSQNSHVQTQSEGYQAQLNQLLALRQAQLLQSQSQPQLHSQHHQIPEQQRSATQNLLGVAYSAAPSVAHVKVTGNGYKFDF